MSNNDPAVNVARLAQDALRKSNPYAARTRVLADEVRQQMGEDSIWWYVPVSVHRDFEHMSSIYDAFSFVETHLFDEHALEILIVPRIIAFRKWEDIA